MTKWIRAVTTGVVTLGLAGAALAAPTAQAAPRTPSPTAQRAVVGANAYTPPRPVWAACADARLKAAGAECTMVTVPLNYSQPKGATIQLAVSRIKHKVPDAQYQGVMLVNPGGPGGSGLRYSRLGASVPDKAGEAYDWIGFDPRGVGSSRPALTCDGNYFTPGRPDYIPTTEAIEKAWLKRARNYAAKCDKAGGALLEHMKTTDSAMDMEMIRKALGAKKINYFGFSYGTYLGQVYSSMYPKKVRRMVFDGVVNPDDVWYRANLNQDLAFDDNVDRYFAWLAEHDDVYHLGDTQAKVKGLWYATLDELRAEPVTVDGYAIAANEWTDAFLSAGYYVYGWTDLADAFAAAINDDDWAPMLAEVKGANAIGPGTDNGFAVYNAVQCTDTTWPSWAKQRLDNWRVYGQAPFETWANNWFNAPCLSWGAYAGVPYPIDGSKVGKALLISETHDAATPFAGAQRVRELYPRSVLIEGKNGTTHSGSLSGVACTDDKIAAYLRDGTLPPRQAGGGSDVTCDPVPIPEPAGAAARAAQKRASATALPADLREGIR